MITDNSNPFLPEIEVVDKKDPVSLNANTLQQSYHPSILLLHTVIKCIALIWYLFGWIFVKSSTLNGVLVLLLVASDFYVTKNISGRLLVHLRWWSSTDRNGQQTWRYESNPSPGNTMGERVDSTVFWLFTLSFPAVWCFFCIISLIRLHFLWFLVCAIAFALSGFNAYLYIQASRYGNQSVSLLNYIPENVKTNAMNSFRSA
ncbi:hypothetical protein WA556_006363, partial [Blastocystis sp. ATCC 50177/Nand II]